MTGQRRVGASGPRGGLTTVWGCKEGFLEEVTLSINRNYLSRGCGARQGSQCPVPRGGPVCQQLQTSERLLWRSEGRCELGPEGGVGELPGSPYQFSLKKSFPHSASSTMIMLHWDTVSRCPWPGSPWARLWHGVGLPSRGTQTAHPGLPGLVLAGGHGGLPGESKVRGLAGTWGLGGPWGQAPLPHSVLPAASAGSCGAASPGQREGSCHLVDSDTPLAGSAWTMATPGAPTISAAPPCLWMGC